MGSSSALAAVLHVLYNGLVVGGLVVVVALLRPALLQGGPVSPTRQERRIEALRTAARAGTLGRQPVRDSPERGRPLDAVSMEFAVLVAGSAAVAGIHAAMVPLHRDAVWPVPVFFAAAALLQMAWASMLVLRRPSGAVLGLGILLNGGVLALWLASRTVGLPAGLGREPVGMWDLVASGWEIAVVIGAVRMVRRGPGAGDRISATWPVSVRACCAAAPVLLVVVALSGGTG